MQLLLCARRYPMSRSFTRSIPALGMLILLGPGLFAAAQAGPAATAGPDLPRGFQFLSLKPGPTANPETGLYERILFAPPDGEFETGNGWEISLKSAIDLGKMAPDERWRAIRRNLGLSPEDGKDFLLWREVVDELFQMLGTLAHESGAATTPPGYGLRVAFPNSDPKDNPEVALTFDTSKDGFEERLSERLAAALTGVEGFVSFVDEEGQPVSTERLRDFPGLKLRLLDGQGKEIAVRELRDYPYYCFPGLPNVPEWGSDYRVVLSATGEGSSDMEAQYVPVRAGMRSRKDLVVKLIRRDYRQQAEKSEEVEKGMRAINYLAEFVETNVPDIIGGTIGFTGIPPLGLILNILPPNPGVHFGFVQTKDAGPQMFLSARFKFRADVPDRSPQFVAKGAIRMEVMTVPSDPGRVSAHYIKVTWLGRASTAQLSLDSRPVSRFPLGLGVGIVPSMSPALYSAGLSYKILGGLEIYAGVGLRGAGDGTEEVTRTSFVYGLTVDVETVLKGLKDAVWKGSKKGTKPAAAEETEPPADDYLKQ
jgi:hypothetical protein